MRYLTSTFGYSKMGMQIETLMDNAIKYAVERNVAKIDRERVKIADE